MSQNVSPAAVVIGALRVNKWVNKEKKSFGGKAEKYCSNSDSFTILCLWVLGLAVSNINESQLQTYESKTLFFDDKSAILLHPATPWDSLK